MGYESEAGMVVVGNGGAAAECIKAIRKQGYSGSIKVFSNVSYAPYNPMLVTYYAAGKINYEQLFPYGVKDSFYDECSVEFHRNEPVVHLDPVKKTVTTSSNNTIEYEKCLIATGASPFIPFSVSENIKGRILTARTVEDAVKLRELLEGQKKKILVLGASMIGIKVVEALQDRGFKVCLADLAEHIFSLSAYAVCSEMIEENLKKKGVGLRFGAAIKSVGKNEDGVLKISFTDSGPEEEADYIVACVGVRPNTAFLDRGQVDIDRGILVDEHMQTNCEGLYAAGDVAQGNDILLGAKRVIGLWANARYQGRTAGVNMAGGDARYSGTIPHNITHFMGMDFVGAGDISGSESVYELMERKELRYARFAWKSGKLVGINLLNIPEIAGIIKNYLVKGLEGSSALEGIGNDSIAMNKVYSLYPELEKAFAQKGENSNGRN